MMIFNKVKLFMKRKTHKTWITSKDLRNMLQNFRTRTKDLNKEFRILSEILGALTTIPLVKLIFLNSFKMVKWVNKTNLK